MEGFLAPWYDSLRRTALKGHGFSRADNDSF